MVSAKPGCDGTLACIVYIVLLASVFLTCRRVYLTGRSRPDLQWLADYARMMEATTVAFLVGAFFLNPGHLDLIYHWLAIIASLTALAHVAYRSEPELSMTGTRDRPAGAISVRWRSALGRATATAGGLIRTPPRWQRRT